MTIECRAGGIQLRSVLKLSGLESITIDFQNLAFGKPSAVLINSLRIGSNQFCQEERPNFDRILVLAKTLFQSADVPLSVM